MPTVPASFHTPVPTLRGWFRSAYRQFEPCERTAAGLPAAPDIATEDWDLLFRAALEVLARAAAQPAVSADPGTVLQPPGTVLRECLAALDHLRRSVPRCGGAAGRRDDRPVAS